MTAQVFFVEFADVPDLVPPIVAHHLALGEPRDAAESLARLDINEEVTDDEVTEAVARIAPHLDAQDRALHYLDLKIRLGEYDDAYAGDSQDAQHDAWARVDMALTELTGRS